MGKRYSMEMADRAERLCCFDGRTTAPASSAEYKTNVAKLDAAHIELFDKANAFYRGLCSGEDIGLLEETLVFLLAYADSHFLHAPCVSIETFFQPVASFLHPGERLRAERSLNSVQ